MYGGRIVEQGSVREIVHAPRHPYTLGLLHANVRPGQRNRPRGDPRLPAEPGATARGLCLRRAARL